MQTLKVPSTASPASNSACGLSISCGAHRHPRALCRRPHPTRGRIILMTTDLTLTRATSLPSTATVQDRSQLQKRPPRRRSLSLPFLDGQHDPHQEKGPQPIPTPQTREVPQAVRRKTRAYHRFLQLGLIAPRHHARPRHHRPQLVWASFGSWLRTIRPHRPHRKLSSPSPCAIPSPIFSRILSGPNPCEIHPETTRSIQNKRQELAA